MAHKCDIAGRSESEAHQNKNDCHHKGRGSGKDSLSPGCQHDCAGRSQTRLGDLCVYNCACWNVPILSNLLILLCAEEACVVLLLHHNGCDPWLIVLFQLYAGLSDGQEFMVESLLKLALRDATSVEDDASGLKTCRFCRTE